MKNALILLTESEAAELRDELDRMLTDKKFSDHAHIDDGEYEREITLALYEDNNLDNFNERVKQLIKSGK